MNKWFNKQTVLGFILGGILFSSIGVFAAVELNVTPNKYDIMVNGEKTDIQGYNIEGRTYLQTRDTAKVLGADLNFKNNTIYIDTNDNTNNTSEVTLNPTPTPIITLTPTQTSADINTNNESEVKNMNVVAQTPDGIEILYTLNDNFEYDPNGKPYLDWMQITNKCKSLNLNFDFDKESQTYQIKDQNNNIIVNNIPTYQKGKIYILCSDYINIILPKIKGE
jgi:hypothetical protein